MSLKCGAFFAFWYRVERLSLLSVIFFLISSLAFAAQRPSDLRGSQRAEFLQDVAQVLEQRKEEIIPLLNEIGAYPGARYEVEQAVRALRGAVTSELDNFKDIQHLNKIVIYGSSNIPLYTLTLQVVIPSLVFDQVVFRASSKTRSVYVRLWDLLRKPLVQKYILNDLLVSSSKSGSSDLMMDHIVGKSTDGLPADVVVFTGNPKNGDELIAQARKALQDELQIQNHRMLFLKFGAGMNPVVIDSQIGDSDMPKAIHASLEHFLVNSGQDCISPNFSLLPLTQKENAIRLIQESVSKIRYGGLQDRKADYSDLTFGTQNSMMALVEFKAKYKSYLVTSPEAQIDLKSKRVDPHVFVLPGRLFKELPLEEFYAPFAVFFTYESEAELQEMIHDPRLAKKAMFASLFGSEKSSTFRSTRTELIRTRHLVFENASVFSAEDGNRPFGGFGADVSTVNYIDKNEGVTKDKQFTRPLLISKEIRKGFAVVRNKSTVQHKSQVAMLNLKTAIENSFSIETYGSTRAVVHLGYQAVEGFSNFSRFVSTYLVLNRLVSEQQKYFASKFNSDLLPASQFLPSGRVFFEEKHFLKIAETETQILAGRLSKTGLSSEAPIQLNVGENGDVNISIQGSADEVSTLTKLISQALSEEKNFSRYSEFRGLMGINPRLAGIKLLQFIEAFKNHYSDRQLNAIDVDSIVKFFEVHPDLSGFLFPVQKWSSHPVLKSIESDVKRKEAIDAYMRSTAQFVLDLNRIVMAEEGEKELRQQLGKWVWGAQDKKFSELIAPWNTQLKVMKSARPVKRRCESLFAN